VRKRVSRTTGGGPELRQRQSDARTVVVTGGARGIGRAIARRFLLGGDQVHTVDVLPDPDDSEGFYHHVCDLSEPENVEHLIEQIASHVRRVDVLVNNAATGFELVDLVDVSADYWQETLSVNLTAPALLSKAFGAKMAEEGSGTIVNVASCSAFQPEAGHTVYAASKAGLLALTRCSARELGRSGVRVVAVVPGWIATETNAPDHEGLEWLRANVSLGRAGLPEEVAEAVHFLAGDSASYITGQAIIVDGGMV
jgi:meso-butanediol dehydrogenase/(S,S)-butanediol dehydrogenase/diacetyl reductase